MQKDIDRNKVAIIDDGVCKDVIQNNIEHYRATKDTVLREQNFFEVYPGNVPMDSHGTVCAQIIRWWNETAFIIDIKILHQGLGTIEDLLLALRWCKERKVRLINISSGFRTLLGLQELNEVCYQLFLIGGHIFAASNNDQLIAYPAASPYVCSVKHREWWAGGKGFRCNADVCARSRYWLKESRCYSQICNSYACAAFTGQISLQQKKKGCVSVRDEDIYDIKDHFIHLYDFRLLYNVYIVGMSEKEQNEVVVGSRLQTLEEVSFSEQPVYLVICNDNIQITENILVQFGKKIKGVIWCRASLPKRIRNFCDKQRIRYWCERLLRERKVKNAVVVPMIFFVGDSEIRQVCLRIQEKFWEEEYNAMAFSDTERAYLFGYRYANSMRNLKNLIYKSDPDVALVYSVKPMPLKDGVLVKKWNGKGYLLVGREEQYISDVDTLYTEIKMMLGGD